MVHGIAEGTMTEDEMKRLSVILKRVATANQIKVFVTWGLNVFGIRKSVADVAGLTQYFGMIEGEYEMRKIVALRGAIYYADVVVGGDMTGDYLHPDAIHFARQLINNTMFQFSLQHFAKVFRGTLGACIMKFKNYWVSQSNRELQIFGNFARSLKGRGKREILSEMSKLLFPSKNMPIPIPLIHKLFGFDPEKVGGFNFKEKGPFPFIKLTTSIGTESPTESFRQLIWTRGLITLFTVGTAHFWIVKRMYQYLGKKSPVNLFSLGRGGESTTGTLGLRFIQALLGGMAIGMSEEDEDENFTQLWRIFLPMYINALADLIKSGDPLKFTRLYGQWGNDFLEYVMGSDAE